MFDGPRGPTGTARLVSHLFPGRPRGCSRRRRGLLYGSCGTFRGARFPGSLDRTVDAEFVLDLLGRHPRRVAVPSSDTRFASS